MFKFLHAADIHLDSPLKGLERYDGAPVEQIRQATRRALENLVQLAIDEQVAFVIIAGDVYDGDWRDFNTGLYFLRQMVRLREEKIPVFFIAGNHDAANRMTRTLRLPQDDFLFKFPADKPHTKVLDNLGVAIHGQSFATAAIENDLSESYPAAVAGQFNIGMLHTCAEPQFAGDHPKYAPCSVSRLVTKGYDYWALGHLHDYQIRHADPHVVFCGNVQGRHIRETGKKGCVIVTAGDGLKTDVEFHPTDVLRWEICQPDVSKADNLTHVLDHLSDDLQKKREENASCHLAVRILLSGVCPAHDRIAANPRQLAADIRARAIEIGGDDIWIECVKMETSAPAKKLHAVDGPVAELRDIFNELRADSDALQVLSQELDDLDRRLPDELKSGNDAINLRDDAFLQDILNQVEPMLNARLHTMEASNETSAS